MTDYGLITDCDPVARLASESVALADATEGNLAAPVPTCPEWTVADLVWHLVEVQRFWGRSWRGGCRIPRGWSARPRPADGQLTAELRAGSTRLVHALPGAAPGEPVWTWASRRDAGFVVHPRPTRCWPHRRRSC